MESNSSPIEIAPPRRRRRDSARARHPHGRVWVIALWIILRFGDLPLVWLAFRAFDAAPQTRVPLFVAILWTPALFAALWAKQIWTRYVTAAFLGIYVCWWGFAAATLMMTQARGDMRIDPLRFSMLLSATLIYLIVAITVLRSRNIRYLTDPAAGWKAREF